MHKLLLCRSRSVAAVWLWLYICGFFLIPVLFVSFTISTNFLRLFENWGEQNGKNKTDIIVEVLLKPLCFALKKYLAIRLKAISIDSQAVEAFIKALVNFKWVN